MLIFGFLSSAAKDTLQRGNSDLEHGDQEKVQCRGLWSIQVQEDRGGDSPRGLEPKHCSSPHLALRPSCTRWLMAFTRRVSQGLSQNHAWYEKQNPPATRPESIISRTRLWWQREVGPSLPYLLCSASGTSIRMASCAGCRSGGRGPAHIDGKPPCRRRGRHSRRDCRYKPMLPSSETGRISGCCARNLRRD